MPLTTSISIEHLASAALGVERMTLKEREQLADEIHARQPNLLYSVIVLYRFGANLAQIDVVLNLLFVLYEAMKISGGNWPVITEDIQDRCLKRIAGRSSFEEGLTPPQKAQAMTDFITSHPQPQMLAYLTLKLQEHGLHGIESETQKMLVLAAMNLVECIAQTTPRAIG